MVELHPTPIEPPTDETAGLAPGGLLILYPSDNIGDGTSVLGLGAHSIKAVAQTL